jgi:hypothetical protein
MRACVHALTCPLLPDVNEGDQQRVHRIRAASWGTCMDLRVRRRSAAAIASHPPCLAARPAWLQSTTNAKSSVANATAAWHEKLHQHVQRHATNGRLRGPSGHGALICIRNSEIKAVSQPEWRTFGSRPGWYVVQRASPLCANKAKAQGDPAHS